MSQTFKRGDAYTPDEKRKIWDAYERQMAKSGKVNWSALGQELGHNRQAIQRAVAQMLTPPAPEPAVVVELPEPNIPPDAPATPEDNDPRAVRQLKREIESAKRDRETLLKQLEENERLVQMFSFIKEAKLEIPEWTRKAPSRGNKKQAIPTALFSDWHLDEVVNPAQVNFVNQYNRQIAEKRLENFFRHTIELASEYLTGLKYEGLVMPVFGDIFSGNIHEELTETNAGTIFESMLYWAEPMCAGIKLLRDAFGRVFIPSVPGNHGRNSRKPKAKNRAQDNFDWFFAHLLRKLLANEKGITFMISEAADVTYSVFNTVYLGTHGDQFRGGSGIAGLLSPLMIGDARKRKRETAVNRGYDFLVAGHWHQLSHFKGLIINGCFPSETKVMTSIGQKDIIDVAKGDIVMSRDGSAQTVTHIFKKESDRLVGIKVAGLPEVVRSTPNHLIWAVKRASGTADVTPSRRHLISAARGPSQWIPMDFLSPGDYVHVPFPKGNERPIDTETAWAYGLFLAEGSALLDGGKSGKHNRISLTMHAREKAVLERWAKWFEGRFNKKPKVELRAGRNTSDLVVSAGREVSKWFRDTFGHGAIGKHLPDGALWWADNLKAAMLDGWITGDGHTAIQPDCRPTIHGKSISEQLAWGMFYLAPAAGYWPTLSKLTAGGRRKSDTYSVHLNIGQNVIVLNGEAFYQIAERFETVGSLPVFDLEVSGEHTYTAGGIGVHNSGKGYDEYAYVSNFDYEPPAQAFWLTDPIYGKTIDAPIHLTDKAERYTVKTLRMPASKGESVIQW